MTLIVIRQYHKLKPVVLLFGLHFFHLSHTLLILLQLIFLLVGHASMCTVLLIVTDYDRHGENYFILVN